MTERRQNPWLYRRRIVGGQHWGPNGLEGEEYEEHYGRDEQAERDHKLGEAVRKVWLENAESIEWLRIYAADATERADVNEARYWTAIADVLAEERDV